MTINKEIHPNSGNESPQNGCLGLLLETMWAWGGASPGAAQSNPSSHGKLPAASKDSTLRTGNRGALEESDPTAPRGDAPTSLLPSDERGSFLFVQAR